MEIADKEDRKVQMSTEAGLRVLGGYFGSFYLDFNIDLAVDPDSEPWTIVLTDAHDVDGNELMFSGKTAQDAIDKATDLMLGSKTGIASADLDIPTLPAQEAN